MARLCLFPPTLEKSFTDIAHLAAILGREFKEFDPFLEVFRWIICNKQNWYVVLDGADDESVFTQTTTSSSDLTLLQHFRSNNIGPMVVTTKFESVAKLFSSDHKAIIGVDSMSIREAVLLFNRQRQNKEKRSEEKQRQDEQDEEEQNQEEQSNEHQNDEDEVKQLVQELNGIPLAVSQAAVYLDRMKWQQSTREYLNSFRTAQSITPAHGLILVVQGQNN